MKYGTPDPSMLANGALAGLVAIAARCAFVTAPSAALIAGAAGVLVCWAVLFRRAQTEDQRSRQRDLGARRQRAVGHPSASWRTGRRGRREWSARSREGLFNSDASQFVAQWIGGRRTSWEVGAMTYVFYKLTAVLVGAHRVSAEAEGLGLDLPETGALAYPDTPDVASAVLFRESAAVAYKQSAA